MLYPIFKGTFTVQRPPSTDPIEIRDYLFMWRKDLGWAIDSSPDIHLSKIAIWGIAWARRSHGCSWQPSRA